MIFQMHVSTLDDALCGVISFAHTLSSIRPRQQTLHSECLCLHSAIDLLSQASLNGPHYFRSHNTVFEDAFKAQCSAWRTLSLLDSVAFSSVTVANRCPVFLCYRPRAKPAISRHSLAAVKCYRIKTSIDSELFFSHYLFLICITTPQSQNSGISNESCDLQFLPYIPLLPWNLNSVKAPRFVT